MKNCNECGKPVDIEAGDEIVGVGILGHQQDNDEIWLNMDNFIARLRS